MRRTYENGRWSRAVPVAERTRGVFSVTISYDGKIFVFCQDITGDVKLCPVSDGEAGSRVILKASENGVYDIFLNALILENEIFLVYNVPEKDKSYNMMRQRIETGGTWSKAEIIDKFTPAAGPVYQMQSISENHVALFYQTKPQADFICGCREITPERQSGFTPYYTGNVPVFDQSVLTTDAGVYVAYVTKSLFSSQLIFKKKDGAAFTRATLIWECARISNVCLFALGGKIRLIFSANEIFYMCVSANGGETFGQAQRYTNKICASPEKAFYISDEAQFEADIFVRDIYVDSYQPWDVQIIPDLYEPFYMPGGAASTAAGSSPFAAAAPDSQISANGDFSFAQNGKNSAISGEKGSLAAANAKRGGANGKESGAGFFNPSSEEILHAQIKGYKKALEEKDSQIEYLTELLMESGYWNQAEQGDNTQ
jgi:hypothetical protein